MLKSVYVASVVHQNGESSQGSFTVANGVEGASRMGSRFSKPFKHRATTDGAPQPLDASVHGVSLSSTEAGELAHPDLGLPYPSKAESCAAVQALGHACKDNCPNGLRFQGRLQVQMDSHVQNCADL